MLTIVLVALAAAALGVFAGWTIHRLRSESEVRVYATKALAGRLAAGRALPVAKRIKELLLVTAMGGLMSPEEREELDKAADDLARILGSLVWGRGRFYRHNVRGSHYELLTYDVNLQTSNAPPVRDGDDLVLYCDTRSGRLSVRHPVEFHDGRFSRATRAEAID